MAGLRLISVNIEGSKHLDLVERFLLAHEADIVCIQELCEGDIAHIESILGARGVFAPMVVLPNDLADQGFEIRGIGIFTKLPVVENRAEYYVGSGAAARQVKESPSVRNRVVLMCDVELEGNTYRIMTTHFTWTPKGEASDEQREDMKVLLATLATLGEFVLCGDFNAPRIFEGKPGEMYSRISEKYKDNIPAEYLTSLDIELHRSGKLRPQELVDKMVDGLFSTPGYAVSEVTLHTGVSDHCAISALIRALK